MSSPRSTRAPLDRLTPREIDVMEQIARGLSNEQIAAVLSIKPHSVKTHLANIYDKLLVDNRTAAAVAYIQREQTCTIRRSA